MDVYPKPQLLRINSWIVVIAWLFGAIFLISLVLLIFGIGQVFFGLLALIPMLFFGIIHLILSFKLRCPACAKMITFQGFSQPHPNTRNRKYLNAWSTIVLDVLTKRNFVCLHCGKAYEVPK